MGRTPEEELREEMIMRQKNNAASKGYRSSSMHGSRLGARIVAGLKEACDVLERGEPLEAHFTVRTVESLPEPGAYDAAKVRTTRQRVGASQAVFAKLVGVSKIQAQSWEQGKRQPSKLARRLLDEINRDRSHWRGGIAGRTGRW